MEQECLDFLLRGDQPVIVSPAKGLGRPRLPAAQRKAIKAGRLAKECVAKTPELLTEVLGERKVPELNEAIFAEDTLHALRRRLSAGELVSVRVRINLPRRDGTAEVQGRRVGCPSDRRLRGSGRSEHGGPFRGICK
jgi:hypothetical protein